MNNDYFAGMTPEQIKDYNEAEKRIETEMIEQYAKDQAVFELVKNQVSRKLFETIESLMEESEHNSNFRITDIIPEGILQIKEGVKVFIYQHSVGDTGDSWAGIESVELLNKKYLTWDYWI